jgi:hypothetical protein
MRKTSNKSKFDKSNDRDTPAVSPGVGIVKDSNNSLNRGALALKKKKKKKMGVPLMIQQVNNNQNSSGLNERSGHPSQRSNFDRQGGDNNPDINLGQLQDGNGDKPKNAEISKFKKAKRQRSNQKKFDSIIKTERNEDPDEGQGFMQVGSKYNLMRQNNFSKTTPNQLEDICHHEKGLSNVELERKAKPAGMKTLKGILCNYEKRCLVSER